MTGFTALPCFLVPPPPPSPPHPCKVIWNPESRSPFNKRMFEHVTPLLRGCLSKNRPLNFALSRISGFVYCVFLCGTNKLEPKKPDALAGYTEPVYSRPFSSLGTADVFFFLRTTRLRIVGLIDEISTKRIHIEEKIKGNFSSICPRSQ